MPSLKKALSKDLNQPSVENSHLSISVVSLDSMGRFSSSSSMKSVGVFSFVRLMSLSVSSLLGSVSPSKLSEVELCSFLLVKVELVGVDAAASGVLLVEETKVHELVLLEDVVEEADKEEEEVVG